MLLAVRNGLSVHAARVLEMRLRARDGLSEVSVMSSVVPLDPAPLTIVDKAPVFGAELDDAT